jgi:hypothetical protein
MAKPVKVRVTLWNESPNPIPGARELFFGHNFSGLMDMLRYAGLLHSNTPGFPDVIEYDTTRPHLANEIARWASFGYKAEVVET